MDTFKVKAMVDKEKNQIIFIESEADFVDVLFGFLTMPMGSVMKLIHKHHPAVRIGCMNNLYRSADSLDEKHFCTRECKSMLLEPQNGAEAHFNRLILNIYEYQHSGYICSSNCAFYNHKLLSRYEGARCACGQQMNIMIKLIEMAHSKDDGVFIKEMARHMIAGNLQIIPPSTASTFSLLSRIGVANVSAIEERNFDVGAQECRQSTDPLTETLLNPKEEPKLIKEDLFHGIRYHSEVGKSDDGTVCVRLVVSKTKKRVCYAEASEDFVDLLFGFLTVPIGHIFKEMPSAPSKGCAFRLYKSVEDLDTEKYFKSEEHKNLLLCPKVAPLFGFDKQLLNVEEALTKKYDFSYYTGDFSTDKSSANSSKLTVVDPKSPLKKVTKGKGGFLKPSSTFTVTDDLIITPVSAVMFLSILNKMQVPPEDIEEYVVHVGEKEANELLVASFISETPLTDVFLSKEPIQEELGKSSY